MVTFEEKDIFSRRYAIIIANIMFLLVMFPYVTPINTALDIQPYALMFGLFYLLFSQIMKGYIQGPKLILSMFLFFFYSLALLPFSSNLFSGIRSLLGYLSIAVISLVAYKTFKLVSYKLFVFVSFIYFFVSFIQKYVNRYFGAALLPRLSTSETRGVTSLAVEPSAFATICIFFIMIFLLKLITENSVNKNVALLSIIMMTLGIIFSGSSMGFMIAGFGIFIYFIYGKNPLKLLVILGITFFLLKIIHSFLYDAIQDGNNSRAILLFYRLFEDPFSLLMTDQSISDRFLHVVLPIISIFENFGFGHGLGNFNVETLMKIIAESPTILQKIASVNISSGRLMSGWGTIFFELGIVGIFLFFIILKLLLSNLTKLSWKNKTILFSIALTTVFAMSQSISISFPLFGYLIGAFQFCKNKCIFERSIYEK